MSFQFEIDGSVSRKELYGDLLKQLAALVAEEENTIANLSNISAAIMQFIPFHWIGFYLVANQQELVLGPFQGPVACTRITKGKGVCGTVWASEKSLLVPDVHAFPGHIACSDQTQSELVVPILQNGKVWAVLDIDSSKANDFSMIDQDFFENVAQLIGDNLDSGAWK